MAYYDDETLKYVEEATSKVSKLGFRLYKIENDGRNREEYSRDYARVLYSASFRRLQGKMQLLGVDNLHFFRNRLTHSMEVAQIARGMAMDLNLDTTFVVEASSLAHDLGNPPFGHHGERVLNEIAKDIGGFEGNAQTLRILNKLEKKHFEFRGLNLTFRTLLGVIKYFYKSDNGINKKFIYDEDYDDILNNLTENGLGVNDVVSIDMQIMDIADEIAYAAHDLEDCLSQNLFTVDDLLYEFNISPKYRSSLITLEEIINHCKTFAYKGTYFNSSEEYSFLFRKELTSQIVNKLIRDVVYNPEKGRLDYRDHGNLSEGLKMIVFFLIMRRPSVQFYEKRGGKVLKELYEVYLDESFNKKMQLLPAEYRIYTSEDERRRNIVDFISGMMDQFALQEHSKYYGINALDKII